MDKHKICKICNRRFANGKAMGGHMRSHLAKHPIPPKPNKNPSSPLPKQHHPSSSSSLLSNNMRTYRSVNRDQFFHLEDDSDAESLRNLKAKTMSKRPGQMISTPTVSSAPPLLPESVSSVAVSSSGPSQSESVSLVTENIFLDKEVALCLLMLSRDKWPLLKDKQVVIDEELVDEYTRDKSDEDEDEDTDGYKDEPCLVESTNNNKSGYKCSTCKKMFRSYQALGGHKASHKKIKISADGSDEVVIKNNQRIFECPFCDKVFNSGQALGGHKKIHFTYLAISSPKNSEKDSNEKLIDLNLPAPEDDTELLKKSRKPKD